MASPSLRPVLGATLVAGCLLCASAFAYDLAAPLFSWPRPPLGSPAAWAFAAFLIALALLLSRRIRRADQEISHLNDTLTRTLGDLSEAAESYGRFVPVQFLKHLKKDSITEIRLGDQVAGTMTVLFSDIRNFTAISEKLTPAENFRFLNSFMGRMGPVVREHYGFIDKYIGDSVMALFDGPVDEALGAAVAMQLAAAEYNHRLSDGLPGPVQVGIGLHSGPLMLGIIGEEGRMESTVISDSVNLASRIESLTKHYDCRILVSRSTFEQQVEPLPYMTRPVDLVRVKGKEHSTELLEILDERFDARSPLRIDLAAHLAEAMMVYRRGEFHEARGLFQALAYKDPEDNLYGIYRRRIEEYIRLGKPEGWDGTTVFDVK